MKKNFCIDCKKKITRQAKRCGFCAQKRKKVSLKTRKKLSKIRRGRKNTFFGKHHTEKTKKRLSKLAKNRFKDPKNHPNYIDNRTNNKYYCIICDKQISLRCGVYGSKLCKSCANTGERSHFWNNGSSFEPYPLGWTKTFKEQVRFRDGYKCQICGCHEVECNRKLHVHHINYNKENLKPDNLISLCLSCHMKTNYNRDYWYAYFTYIMENQKCNIIEISN